MEHATPTIGSIAGYRKWPNTDREQAQTDELMKKFSDFRESDTELASKCRTTLADCLRKSKIKVWDLKKLPH